MKSSLFADFNLPRALRGLLDRVSSLLRRDGHPSKAKPVGGELPEVGTLGRSGDEREAIAANLFLLLGHWQDDDGFSHWTWDDPMTEVAEARRAFIEAEQQRWVAFFTCGGPHCEQGHHTCDDPAVD